MRRSTGSLYGPALSGPPTWESPDPLRAVPEADALSKRRSLRRSPPRGLSGLPFVCGCLTRASMCPISSYASLPSNFGAPFFASDSVA